MHQLFEQMPAKTRKLLTQQNCSLAIGDMDLGHVKPKFVMSYLTKQKSGVRLILLSQAITESEADSDHELDTGGDEANQDPIKRPDNSAKEVREAKEDSVMDSQSSEEGEEEASKSIKEPQDENKKVAGGDTTQTQ